MLSYILDLDEVPPENQKVLFELAEQRKDHRTLARLGHVANLLPELDDELGKMDAAPVVEAWVTRPGRSVDVVSARLRKERRVGVLTACAALDLEPTLYEDIAAANSSPTVATAVLNADRSTVKARCIAAANAAKAIDADRKIDHDALRGALAVTPEVAEAFALATATVESASVALAADELTEEAGMHLVEVLAKSLSTVFTPVDDEARQWNHDYRLTWRCEKLRTTAEEVLQSPWCTPAMRTRLAEVLTVGESMMQARYDQEADQRWSKWKSLAEEYKATAEMAASDATSAGSGLGPLVLAARTATCADDLVEVNAAMGGQWNENVQRRSVLAGAVLVNANLPVEARLTAAEAYPNPWQLMRIKRFLDLPLESWVALSLVRPWHFAVDQVATTGRLAEFTELLAESYHLSPGPAALQLLLGSRALTPEMLLLLPVKDLSDAMINEATPPEVRTLVAKALSEALEGQPATVWAMFDKMSYSYAGTLEQLVKTCRAAVA